MAIMDLRSYQRSYQAVQQAEASPNSTEALASLPDAVRTLVRETEFAIVQQMRGGA